jgi:hypothetical protein
MKLKLRIKRYPIESFLLLGFVVTILFDSPHILRQMGLSGDLRATAEAQNQKHNEMKLSQQAAADASEIAKERYQNGLLMVLSKNNQEHYATVVEGKPVKDRDGSVIPAGTIVGDGYGNTAVIAVIKGVPVATQVAFTGDRKAIEKARRFESAAYSSN